MLIKIQVFNANKCPRLTKYSTGTSHLRRVNLRKYLGKSGWFSIWTSTTNATFYFGSMFSCFNYHGNILPWLKYFLASVYTHLEIYAQGRVYLSYIYQLKAKVRRLTPTSYFIHRDFCPFGQGKIPGYEVSIMRYTVHLCVCVFFVHELLI